MGIDGVSVNQLRITPEVNVSLNSQTNDVKRIDGLSEGQRVDPDQEKEKEHKEQDNQAEESEEQEFDEEVDLSIPFEALKYDLSDSQKYSLVIDKESNNVIISKKDTGEVLQVFSAEVLKKVANNLQDGHGILINRKY